MLLAIIRLTRAMRPCDKFTILHKPFRVLLRGVPRSAIPNCQSLGQTNPKLWHQLLGSPEPHLKRHINHALLLRPLSTPSISSIMYPHSQNIPLPPSPTPYVMAFYGPFGTVHCLAFHHHVTLPPQAIVMVCDRYYCHCGCPGGW